MPPARIERGFRANAGVRVKSEVVMSAPSQTIASDAQQCWFAAALFAGAWQHRQCSPVCMCRSMTANVSGLAYAWHSDMPDTLRSLKELECLGNGKAPDQGYKVGERTRWRD